MHSAVGAASIFRKNAPRSGNPALGVQWARQQVFCIGNSRRYPRGPRPLHRAALNLSAEVHPECMSVQFPARASRSLAARGKYAWQPGSSL